MSDAATIRLTPEKLLAVSDALVAAEQGLMRYNGLRIQLDAEPFKADFTRDFRRLLRAKRLLRSELTDVERTAIVSALEYAGIAIALHQGAAVVNAAHRTTMDFGNDGERVQAALEALGIDRRARGPFPPD